MDLTKFIIKWGASEFRMRQSEFRMGQHMDSDHHEDASHFTKIVNYEKVIFHQFQKLPRSLKIDCVVIVRLVQKIKLCCEIVIFHNRNFTISKFYFTTLFGKILILDFRIGSFAFGQNSTISCISSSQESDLLFIGIDYPSGGGGEIVIFNPFLSIRLKRIRNVF